MQIPWFFPFWMMIAAYVIPVIDESSNPFVGTWATEDFLSRLRGL
jgi:hypothetical protein